jgi:hypothetical protein
MSVPFVNNQKTASMFCFVATSALELPGKIPYRSSRPGCCPRIPSQKSRPPFSFIYEHGNALLVLPPHHPDSEITHVIDAQCAIGWFPFLMGHISNHWKSVQHAYFLWQGRRNTGKKWATQLIIQLQNVSWDMWEHRNGILHNTMTPAKLRALARLDDSIQEEYSAGTHRLLPRDHRWFDKPIETVLGYPFQEKEQWLSSVLYARIRWRHRRDVARASLDASRRVLRNWLVRAPPPPAVP